MTKSEVASRNESEAHVLQVRLRHDAPQRPREEGREGRVADDAAQKGDGVDDDLKRGEELAGMVLEFHHEAGTAVTLVGKRLEPGFAGCGQGDFGRGEKGTEQHQAEKRKHLRERSHTSAIWKQEPNNFITRL